MMTKEEAEWRWREVRAIKPSYWGEKEGQKLGRKIREERARIAEERREHNV